MRKYAIQQLIGHRFKAALNEFKKRKKLTTRELAELTGFQEYTVFRWLRKDNVPTSKTIKLVAARLEMNINDIMYGAVPTQKHYIVSDWDLFGGLCDQYTKVMADNRVEIGEEILQDIVMRLYRYLRNYGFPVVLQCNGQTATEHLAVLLMMSHPNSTVTNYQLTIYGGMEDNVYATLDRLVPRRNRDTTIATDGFNMTSGKFTCGWLKHATEHIREQLKIREDELENLVKPRADFEKYAENLSEI